MACKPRRLHFQLVFRVRLAMLDDAGVVLFNGLVSLRENLHRKPYGFYHQRNLGLSGVNFPIIQFYDLFKGEHHNVCQSLATKNPQHQQSLAVCKLNFHLPSFFFYMGVSENVVYPIVPNGFADHYPYNKWLFHWEY